MSTGLQFDDEMARRIEAVYLTRDAARRRQAVLEALQLKPGDHVLDIGPGPGFVAYEMADAVGAEGRVHGVDISEPMLELARRRCADKPWVDFQPGEATALPVSDTSFDVAVSVQVYEYVSEVTSALSEMWRVLRPGGRGVIVITDWESIVWHAMDKERMDRVLSAFQGHCAYASLPRTFAPTLRQVGFQLQDQTVITQFNPAYDSGTYSYQIIPIIGSFVPGKMGITQEEAQAWIEDLQRLGEKEEYFFCLNQFLYLVSKPG